jgi:acyl dehydratase
VSTPAGHPRVTSITDLMRLEGKELGPSSWLEVTQEMVSAFADATLDRQWIHLDRDRATHGPYGTTVAHGFLVLSLGPHLVRQVLDLTALQAGINYGVNRVRFPSPTPVGTRLRLKVVIHEVTAVTNGARVTMNYTFEREGGERPVCVAEVVSQMMFAPE